MYWYGYGVMKNYFLARLQEPSTWRGIVMFLTGCGIAIEPQWIEPMIAVGSGMAGLIAICTADRS